MCNFPFQKINFFPSQQLGRGRPSAFPLADLTLVGHHNHTTPVLSYHIIPLTYHFTTIFLLLASKIMHGLCANVKAKKILYYYYIIIIYAPPSAFVLAKAKKKVYFYSAKKQQNIRGRLVR